MEKFPQKKFQIIFLLKQFIVFIKSVEDHIPDISFVHIKYVINRAAEL